MFIYLSMEQATARSKSWLFMTLWENIVELPDSSIHQPRITWSGKQEGKFIKKHIHSTRCRSAVFCQRASKFFVMGDIILNTCTLLSESIDIFCLCDIILNNLMSPRNIARPNHGRIALQTHFVQPTAITLLNAFFYIYRRTSIIVHYNYSF